MDSTGLICRPGLEPAEPLYTRVPIRDESGQYLTDFMMIIPGLRQRSAQLRQEVLGRIDHVLQLYRRTVVFADFNMKTSVLWVSVKPVPGICLELPAVIKFHVPEALLVSHRAPG
ncbi:hypothetical protein [Thiohalophilus thiocyanatoxydans]|uniref:Uncharacterized protein n=1 Tax=Thiohalophilus thiocyanatoxydans TaxID=381308 RepID=A0A4R8ILG8_9GAMM|nr:hypothetical protein [Thiohalophilus thiocyanatoxydans]TDY00964.1 hypothetical protein EDC23_1710 [Thiohalophilus thiocyanatoxydans]